VKVNKIGIAIVGPGNIGTDLMYKILKRSRYMNIQRMVGIFPPSISEGLRLAQQEGIDIAWNGIDGVIEIADEIDLVLEATTAKAHLENAPVYRDLGLIAIDLTPAAIGPYTVPAVNLEANLGVPNVNMVTCGGQATIPIVHAINKVSPVEYAEIVSSISSKSAGPGTRKNIDEFTQTTAKGLEEVGGAKRGKAIIVLNPAEPPIIMQNTIHCIVEDISKKDEILKSIERMVRTIQNYVPGYDLKISPVVYEEENRITVIIRVIGEGDYLPTYAGNLDIMTAAAMATAERFAENILKERMTGKGVAAARSGDQYGR